MIVYGDRARTADPRALIAALERELAAAQAPGIARHAALVGALIAAGELAQGLADAAFATRGADGPDPAADAALALTVELGRAVVASWRGLDHDEAAFDPAVALERLAGLAALPLPGAVTARTAEGYAFYAVYPEACAEAAATLPPGLPTTVVGLRSIGTSLAAVVAATLEAETVLSVRPTGPPFARTLALSPEVEATLAGDRRVVVVDEGPGLSGSSFGAVLDRLRSLGVPLERIHVLPSHRGDPGPQASPAHRARWVEIDRRQVSFEAAIAPRLPAWAEPLTGPSVSTPIDLSGGAWRALRYAAEGDWPPVNAGQERRKLLIRGDGGPVLLKFAGLGEVGARKLARARTLHAAGFTPEPLGLVHGFLAERWIEPARPLDPAAIPREALIAHLAAYIGFRARAFPATAEDGADLPALLDMARANTAEALGEAAAARLEPWRARLPALSGRVRRAFTDNRLHAWEWMVAPDGAVLKTDALDHAQAHDLVGAQDPAWDVASAAVEFALAPVEAEVLRRSAGGAAGALIDPELVCFSTLAYLAFQLGLWSLAADAHAGWPEEHARLTAARDRCAVRLGAAVGSAAGEVKK